MPACLAECSCLTSLSVVMQGFLLAPGAGEDSMETSALMKALLVS